MTHEMMTQILKLAGKAQQITNFLNQNDTSIKEYWDGYYQRAYALQQFANNIASGIALLCEGKITIESFAYHVDQKYRIDGDYIDYFMGDSFPGNEDDFHEDYFMGDSFSSNGDVFHEFAHFIPKPVRNKISQLIDGFFTAFDNLVKSENIKIKKYVRRNKFHNDLDFTLWSKMLAKRLI